MSVEVVHGKDVIYPRVTIWKNVYMDFAVYMRLGPDDWLMVEATVDPPHRSIVELEAIWDTYQELKAAEEVLRDASLEVERLKAELEGM